MLLRALLPVVFLSAFEPPPSLMIGIACGVGGSRDAVGNAVPEAWTGAATGARVVGSSATTGVVVVGRGTKLVGGIVTEAVGAELDGATSVGAITGVSCGGCVPVGKVDDTVGAAVPGAVATTPDT